MTTRVIRDIGSVVSEPLYGGNECDHTANAAMPVLIRPIMFRTLDPSLPETRSSRLGMQDINAISYALEPRACSRSWFARSITVLPHVVQFASVSYRTRQFSDICSYCRGSRTSEQIFWAKSFATDPNGSV